MPFWLWLIGAIGLMIWIVVAFVAARFVQLAGKHAGGTIYDLRTPVTTETFAGEYTTDNKPVAVRNPLTFIVSYANAVLLVIVCCFALFGGVWSPVLACGFFSLVLAGAMFRWYVEYREADDERRKHIPNTSSIRIESVRLR